MVNWDDRLLDVINNGLNRSLYSVYYRLLLWFICDEMNNNGIGFVYVFIFIGVVIIGYYSVCYFY